MKYVYWFGPLVNGMAGVEEHDELKNKENKRNRWPRRKRHRGLARAKMSLVKVGERNNTNMNHLNRRFVKTIKGFYAIHCRDFPVFRKISTNVEWQWDSWVPRFCFRKMVRRRQCSGNGSEISCAQQKDERLLLLHEVLEFKKEKVFGHLDITPVKIQGKHMALECGRPESNQSDG